MKDVNCPYCNEELEINHDDGYGYEEGYFHQQQCNFCEKTFVFDTEISFYYTASKADCLNENGNHKWKQIIGAPKAYFVGKFRCLYCGEKSILDKEANEKAMEEYMSKLKGVKNEH